MSVHIVGVKTPWKFKMEVLYLDCKNPICLCLATSILDIREFVWNTYEKLEMDADWWKNDAAKVNEMESAAVKHEIESNYGGNENLRWK